MLVIVGCIVVVLSVSMTGNGVEGDTDGDIDEISDGDMEGAKDIIVGVLDGDNDGFAVVFTDSVGGTDGVSVGKLLGD